MEGIKYVNLIEIGPVVIEIRGDENGELAVPVNNTLLHHTAFLVANILDKSNIGVWQWYAGVLLHNLLNASHYL